MFGNFPHQLKNAKKSCLISGDTRKVLYEFGNGKEMMEEYNLTTNVVVRRLWRRQDLEGQNKWEVELGDPEPHRHNEDNVIIKENSSQPFVSRRATRINLEWRIRNLPYPVETYSVGIDPDKCHIIVKTSNKKYYKILPIPELHRLKLIPKKEQLTFTHKFNTLIISYRKPQALLKFEQEVLKEVYKIDARSLDCNL